MPLAVADSAEELAKITGVRADNIRSSAWKFKKGLYKASEFRCVIVDDEEDDE